MTQTRIAQPALANLLGVSRQSLHNWRREGWFPEPEPAPKRIGHAMYYDLQKVKLALLAHPKTRVRPDIYQL